VLVVRFGGGRRVREVLTADRDAPRYSYIGEQTDLGWEEMRRDSDNRNVILDSPACFCVAQAKAVPGAFGGVDGCS
jgi:hypothetical protein